MDIQLILLLLIVVIVAVIAGNVISSVIQKKNSFSPKEIIEKIDSIKEGFDEKINPVKENILTNKNLIENVKDTHERLVNSLTGSSRFGIAAELLLDNFFKNSGLIEGTQYIKNQSYKKDGKNLRVEYAIKHPTGLVFPIDSHWTKTQYEHLLELRKETPSDHRDHKIKEKYKEIIKDYGEKAKKVNKDYINSDISTDFACVYVPSESLYLELNTHITENKELWISEIQKRYKVTFMGPSTFSAYCSALLLGFKTISADRKAKLFIKYLDKLKELVMANHEKSETHHHKHAEALWKHSAEVLRTAEKLKNELEKIEEELKEMEKKNED